MKKINYETFYALSALQRKLNDATFCKVKKLNLAKYFSVLNKDYKETIRVSCFLSFKFFKRSLYSNLENTRFHEHFCVSRDPR